MSAISLQVFYNGVWVSLPAPSEYKVSMEDLDGENSKRYITTGRLKRSRIRKNVFKISLSYKLTNLDKLSLMLDAVSEEATFRAKFYHPIRKAMVEREFYNSKKSYSYKHLGNGVYRVEGLSFDLTEV